MKFTIISLSRSSDEYFRLHRADCADVAKDSQLGNPETVEAPNADAAAAAYIDGELDEMGYTVRDVKIIGCAR